jgi:uncharacterized protein YqhQ
VKPPQLYGGQAVIEGVLIRGRRTLALACRRPNGEIYRYREALDSILLRSRLARLPFVRGIIVLWESLAHGMRMLMRSAELQMEAESQELGRAGTTGAVVVAVALGLGIFVGIPYVATQAMHAFIRSDVLLNIAEGILRLVLFLGYLGAISFLPEIRRVFAYHGAEHMTIHAFERGDPLVPASVRPYPTAHPRCGTAFLLFVVVVSIALFAFLPRTHFLIDLVARILLVIPVAAISYEILRFGAARESTPLVRLAVAPGLLLQRVTTRVPDDGMIEVAIASLEEALAGDRESEPAAAPAPAPAAGAPAS